MGAGFLLSRVFVPLFVPPLKIALRKRIGASAHLLLQKMTSAQGGATNGQKRSLAVYISRGYSHSANT